MHNRLAVRFLLVFRASVAVDVLRIVAGRFCALKPNCNFCTVDAVPEYL